MRTKSVIAGIVAAALACTGVFAQDDDGGGFSGNVTLASDYSFRGVSQTGLLPAIQGGVDYDLGNGFSFGTWASNVNYDDGTSQELDLYVGFSTELNDSTSMSFTMIQLEYPGEGEGYDYQEYAASLDMNDLSLGFVYSPSYVGVDDWSFTYISVGYGTTLGENVSFSAAIGLSSADEIGNDGDDSYVDYSVGFSVPVSGLDLGLTVVGTNLEDIDAAEGRLVFSIGKAL